MNLHRAFAAQLAERKDGSNKPNIPLFVENKPTINKLVSLNNYKALSMTKSDLITAIAKQQPHLPCTDVELAIKCMLEQMSHVLATGERIEIRGFGGFSLHYRSPRKGRNPKTSDAVALTGKYVPHFRPGKELRDRVNSGF